MKTILYALIMAVSMSMICSCSNKEESKETKREDVKAVANTKKFL